MVVNFDIVEDKSKALVIQIKACSFELLIFYGFGKAMQVPFFLFLGGYDFGMELFVFNDVVVEFSEEGLFVFGVRSGVGVAEGGERGSAGGDLLEKGGLLEGGGQVVGGCVSGAVLLGLF